ncbi:uncharacterized protein JN550_012863 [Neoarthrinium moseri]|uniref:uncharacterized protein n=1 Tax=Neoarthrinium moseri TaxID=1658444 RepID=UPI001FDCE6C9|nr:uncharacterized protein JN550_012863 [Neoarthrinium moseri]KAI1858107.1 hypothetical protein JN550_012863 [Neoarthrinium moseri]
MLAFLLVPKQLLAILAIVSSLDAQFALGATIPRGTDFREGFKATDLELNPNTTDLIDKRWDWAGADARRRINVGYKIVGGVGAAYSFFSLIKDCKAYSDGENDKGTRSSCVFAGIAVTAALATVVDQSTIIQGSIREKIATSSWSMPNWRDLFKPNWTLRPQNARDLESRTDDALQILSKKIGAETRHIGMWKDTDSKVAKRDGVAQEVAVLGAKVDGHDFHFAYLGEADGQHHFKLGIGRPVNETLGKRAVDPYVHGVYFDRGGLNFWASPEPAWKTTNKSGPLPWVDTDEEFGWLREQTQCTLNRYIWGFQQPLAAHGLNFQIYNNMIGETLCAGGISPFGANGLSDIKMTENFAGGARRNKKCMADLKMDAPKSEL